MSCLARSRASLSVCTHKSIRVHVHMHTHTPTLLADEPINSKRNSVLFRPLSPVRAAGCTHPCCLDLGEQFTLEQTGAHVQQRTRCYSRRVFHRRQYNGSGSTSPRQRESDRHLHSCEFFFQRCKSVTDLFPPTTILHVASTFSASQIIVRGTLYACCTTHCRFVSSFFPCFSLTSCCSS